MFESSVGIRPYTPGQAIDDFAAGRVEHVRDGRVVAVRRDLGDQGGVVAGESVLLEVASLLRVGDQPADCSTTVESPLDERHRPLVHPDTSAKLVPSSAVINAQTTPCASNRRPTSAPVSRSKAFTSPEAFPHRSRPSRSA